MKRESVTIEQVTEMISHQFPKYRKLEIKPVEIQGHDNYSFRLGSELIVRVPAALEYASKVPIEYRTLPEIAKCLSFPIPIPLHLGRESRVFPYPFLISTWLPGISLNLMSKTKSEDVTFARNLAQFLKQLQSVTQVAEIKPALHNWYRGSHISVYDQQIRQQTKLIDDYIDTTRILTLWDSACATKWQRDSVWVHGDIAPGNLIFNNGDFYAVIDFGGLAVGDPACDLVIAWTYFKGRAREVFISEMDLDQETWLRAKAWALWKSTYELSHGIEVVGQSKESLRAVIGQVLEE